MSFVQPIVVNPDGSHENTITAVALACVKAYRKDYVYNPEPWDQWLAGSFTKIVKRAKKPDLTQFAISGMSYVEVVDSAAVGYVPCETQPLEVRRLQLSDLNLPQSGKWPVMPLKQKGVYLPPPTVYVALNPDVAMSTGKLAAQAAHGLLKYVLEVDPQVIYHPWQCTADPDIFRRLRKTADVKIKDAGHTEIKPGTLTVLVGK